MGVYECTNTCMHAWTREERLRLPPLRLATDISFVNITARGLEGMLRWFGTQKNRGAVEETGFGIGCVWLGVFFFFLCFSFVCHHHHDPSSIILIIVGVFTKDGALYEAHCFGNSVR